MLILEGIDAGLQTVFAQLAEAELLHLANTQLRTSDGCLCISTKMAINLRQDKHVASYHSPGALEATLMLRSWATPMDAAPKNITAHWPREECSKLKPPFSEKGPGQR